MTNNGKIALTGGTVLDPEGNLVKKTLLCVNGKIESLLGPKEILNSDISIINVDGYYVVPGFIDTHIHGSNGQNFMNANIRSIHEISEEISAGGVTSCLATTTSADIANIKNVIGFISNNNGINSQENIIDILGVHMEGPYINPLLAASHNKHYIKLPQPDEVEQIIKVSKGVLKLVTIAPEVVGGNEAIIEFSRNGISVSIGHTNATYEQTKTAIKEGATRGTHFFNSMRVFHHREPGPTMALLENPDIFIEVIADGNHIKPDVLSYLISIVGYERIVLITDRADVAGMPDGNHTRWEGTEVILNGNRCVSIDGKLAGSTLKMSEAVRNIFHYTNVSLSEAFKMGSEIPARSIGVINEKGNFIRGKDADITVLDKELSVKMTIVKGNIIYNTL